jgi:alpha-amylase
MTLVSLYFFAHQPERLRPYALRPNARRTPVSITHDLFDEELDATIFRKVAEKCYFPATRLLEDLVNEYKGQAKPFRIAFGLSGTFIEQAQRSEPELIAIFQRLAKTGMVEFTGEVYYHSLASLWDDQRAEFRRQVALHADTIERLFGRRPTVFRNTECLYNNDIAHAVKDMGYSAIMTEGIDWILDSWRSPDFVYRSVDGLPVLLRNYRFSDDIGYRFPNRAWEHFPLTAEKLAGWMAGNTDEIINIMIDYEALGEHIWAETGIFEFMRHLPREILQYPQLSFTTPSAAVAALQPRGAIDVGPFATISWADMERDTSAWLRNDMQRFCFEELRQMEPLILKTEQPEFIRAWRLLQTSDHVYYLSDKSLSDGDVHTYFSAYGNLYEGFVRLLTAIMDLKNAALNYLDANTPREIIALATPPADLTADGAASVPAPRARARARAKTVAEAEVVADATPAKPKRAPRKKADAIPVETPEV